MVSSIFSALFYSVLLLCVIHFTKQLMESVGMNITFSKPKRVGEKEKEPYLEMLEEIKKKTQKPALSPSAQHEPIVIDNELDDFIQSL